MALFRMMILALCFSAAAAAEPFEDSPALTNLWSATSSASTEQLMSTYIQKRDHAKARAADGRGPMFWAYEFKNVDALALLMHLEVDADQEDTEGKAPKSFFPGEADAMSEFEESAKAKVEELATLLAEREEEFYSYQQAESDPDDYDDEVDEDEDEEGSPSRSASSIDEIDYADDEDEDEDEDVGAKSKDEM